MNIGIQTERYAQAAQREVETGSPREPQWTQAVADASGDPEAATEHYVSTRLGEISDHELEHEAAEQRLRQLQQFDDDLALTGGLKFALFAVPLILIVVSLVYWSISK